MKKCPYLNCAFLCPITKPTVLSVDGLYKQSYDETGGAFGGYAGGENPSRGAIYLSIFYTPYTTVHKSKYISNYFEQKLKEVAQKWLEEAMENY